jgi:hypothetical protein
VNRHSKKRAKHCAKHRNTSTQNGFKDKRKRVLIRLVCVVLSVLVGKRGDKNKVRMKGKNA